MKRTTSLVLLIFAAVAGLVLSPGCSGGSGDGKARRPAPKISERTAARVTGKLQLVSKPVTLHLYTGGGDAAKTAEASAFMDLVAAGSEFVTLEKHSITAMPPGPARVDHGPATAFTAGDDPEFLRYYYLGTPDDLEVEPFMDGVLMASGKTMALSGRTLQFIDNLQEDVTIRVFVSPT